MMVGEDGEEDGPGSFGHASVWGRISVVAALDQYLILFLHLCLHWSLRV